MQLISVVNSLSCVACIQLTKLNQLNCIFMFLNLRLAFKRLLSNARKRRPKSSLLFGFMRRSNSFLIRSSFSLRLLISSCISHSCRSRCFCRTTATRRIANQRRKYFCIIITCSAKTIQHHKVLPTMRNNRNRREMHVIAV